ncbi:MAG: hypothetical protein II297_02165 [Clostridia bacterium]|nr:hypothetical protein [Clostridia bacterium]
MGKSEHFQSKIRGAAEKARQKTEKKHAEDAGQNYFPVKSEGTKIPLCSSEKTNFAQKNHLTLLYEVI